MYSLNKNVLCLALLTSLITACGSFTSPGGAASSASGGTSTSTGADANGTSGAACGNGNAATTGNSNDANALTAASYKYAFFLRDDWTNPLAQEQTDLYVFITEDPNFCVANPNAPLYDTVTVNHDIPTLSFAYSWRQDPNAGPIVIDPNTYLASVEVDTNPLETSGYEVSENGNTRICDLYGSGNPGSNTSDLFGASVQGAFTIQNIAATSLDFTLDANMPTYTVPASRGEPAVFSGQNLQYTLRAKACKFMPSDLTKGAPNSPPAVAVGLCPG